MLERKGGLIWLKWQKAVERAYPLPAATAVAVDEYIWGDQDAAPVWYTDGCSAADEESLTTDADVIDFLNEVESNDDVFGDSSVSVFDRSRDVRGESTEAIFDSRGRIHGETDHCFLPRSDGSEVPAVEEDFSASIDLLHSLHPSVVGRMTAATFNEVVNTGAAAGKEVDPAVVSRTGLETMILINAGRKRVNLPLWQLEEVG